MIIHNFNIGKTCRVMLPTFGKDSIVWSALLLVLNKQKHFNAYYRTICFYRDYYVKISHINKLMYTGKYRN
jgi:hypothetical protein